MILCMEVLHLAANYALWKLVESSFPKRLDIEQIWFVREMTAAWDLDKSPQEQKYTVSGGC